MFKKFNTAKKNINIVTLACCSSCSGVSIKQVGSGTGAARIKRG